MQKQDQKQERAAGGEGGTAREDREIEDREIEDREIEDREIEDREIEDRDRKTERDGRRRGGSQGDLETEAGNG
jgi:hypothetical protein